MLEWSHVVMWSHVESWDHTNTQTHKLKVKKKKVFYFSYSFGSLPVPGVTGAGVRVAVVVGGGVTGSLVAGRVAGQAGQHCFN